MNTDHFSLITYYLLLIPDQVYSIYILNIYTRKGIIQIYFLYLYP